MHVLKAGGRVFGAKLTAAEQKAMDLEIGRQLAEAEKLHAREVDALILFQLRTQLGFGHKRLERFYRKFSAAYEELIAHYEMEGSGLWLIQQQLLEYGIDLEKWERGIFE